MSDSSQDQTPSEADAELERQVRADRKFTLTEAVGRMVGPGGMKGASPITRKQQAEIEIETLLRQHLADAEGALQTVLLRRVKGSELLSTDFAKPLKVLADSCRRIVSADDVLQEFVRDVDAEWGRAFEQRPHFDTPGTAPHPEDPYTHDSVRQALTDLIERVRAAGETRSDA